MKFKNKLKFLIIIFSVFISIAWLSQTVVNVDPVKDNDSITLYFQISEGFGVQKEGPHKIEVYQLSKDHSKTEDIKEKISKYGKKIDSKEKFVGHTASADEDYFDNLDPLVFKQKQFKTGEFAVKAVIYYCSFSDKFCSAQKIEKLVE
ncbi:MAG: hypothetical protein OEZ22_12550 [Spirochaetia bacterium]|nr:hypothetical protein [Spirochaetia bacterium]